MDEKTENIYKTNDLFLSAYLKYKKYELADIVKNGSKVIFCFTDQPNRKEDVLDFYNDKGGFISFIECLKRCKSLTYTY